MESIQIFSELLHKVSGYRVICVHGKSGSGKTTIASRLARGINYPIFHTDDYQKHGWEQSLYMLMNDLQERQRVECIIEGVQVPRLLRKGFKTDLVIEIVCSEEIRIARYHQRGHMEKVHKLAGFDTTLGKIWRECNVTCPVIRFDTTPLHTGI